MRDRNLEKNIRRVEAFVDSWKQLSQFLDRGFKGDPFAAEEEAAFLELKSRIAQDYELLMVTLASEADRDDRALRMLNSVPSLSAFKGLPEGMSKKLATEWHSTYLGLQALLGRLRGRQAQLQSVSTLRVGMRNVLANPLVILLFMVAASYGVYRFAEEWIPKLTQLKEQMEKK
ncbi:MAG TPA: hypothetical protein VLZ30_09905 [Verrucomicrobiae bacterium]|nr:hypothetical protein [Verrucomicrobiae bacterium]